MNAKVLIKDLVVSRDHTEGTIIRLAREHESRLRAGESAHNEQGTDCEADEVDRMNPLKQLEACGQSPWLDYLKRSLIENGELHTLIARDGLKGVTSNPSIFEKAIAGSTDYDDALAELRGPAPLDAKGVYEGLAIADLRGAARAPAISRRRASTCNQRGEN